MLLASEEGATIVAGAVFLTEGTPQCAYILYVCYGVWEWCATLPRVGAGVCSVCVCVWRTVLFTL